MKEPNSNTLSNLSELPRRLIAVSALVVVFFIIDKVMDTVFPLTAKGYAEPSVLLGLIKSGDMTAYVALALAVGIVIFLPKSWACWTSEDRQKGWWLFALVTVGLLTWWMVTLGPNYFFGQTYGIDRLLMVILAGLSVWRPIFLVPFLLISYAFMHQVSVPEIGGTVLAHKMFPLEGLTVLTAWILLRATPLRVRTSDVVLVMACLVAGRYFAAGYAKYLNDWSEFGHLYNGIYSAYGHGFTRWMPIEYLRGFANFVKALDGVLVWAVIGLELGFLFLLFHLRVSILMLTGAVLFHLGVFTILGFLFWPWIAMDILMAILLIRHARDRADPVYTLTTVVLSVPLIVLSLKWSDPPRLAWFDTGLSYVTSYRAVGPSGTIYEVGPRFFDPYGDQMTFSAFGYLSDEPRLSTSYGAGFDLDLIRTLQTAQSPEDVLAVEARLSKSEIDHSARRQVFLSFLTHYIKNWNKGCICRKWWQHAQPPAQFWSFPGNEGVPVYRGQEPVSKLIIVAKTRWFDGENFRIIKSEEIAELDF